MSAANPTQNAGTARWRRDAALRPEIERVWRKNRRVYGARNVWRQLGREAVPVARRTVKRLMQSMGLHGVLRVKPRKWLDPEVVGNKALDRANRQFTADTLNALDAL